jgi:hypothetical protein
MPVQAYYKRCMNLVDVIDHIEDNMGYEPKMLETMTTSNNKNIEELTDDERQSTKEQYLTLAFIFGADRGRFSQLINKLQNNYLQGYDGYPKTVQSAYSLLSNWRQNIERPNSKANENIAFTTTNTNQGSCHWCKKQGQCANECPSTSNDNHSTSTNVTNVTVESPNDTENSRSGTAMVMTSDTIRTGFQFHQLGNKMNNLTFRTWRSASIPRTWILLDNQSTIDIFCNPS